MSERISSLNWIKAIVIDDSPSMLDYTQHILSQSFDITSIKTATNASDGLSLLTSNVDTNLMLIDLNLPDMDGIQILTELAKRHYTGFIIVISSVSLPILKSVETLALELKLNFLAAIQKPYDEESLHDVFEKLQQNKSKQKQTEQLKIYELIRGLNQHQYLAYAQPLIDLYSGQLHSIETLIRLNHPSKGVISPDAFIPLAESSELISSLTLEMSEAAIKAYQKIGDVCWRTQWENCKKKQPRAWI